MIFLPVPGDSSGYTFDTSNASLLRFLQEGIAIDCIKPIYHTEVKLTVSLYLVEAPFTVYRDSLNILAPTSAERILYSAANRLAIHLRDLESVLGNFTSALRGYLDELRIYTL